MLQHLINEARVIVEARERYPLKRSDLKGIEGILKDAGAEDIKIKFSGGKANVSAEVGPEGDYENTMARLNGEFSIDREDEESGTDMMGEFTATWTFRVTARWGEWDTSRRGKSPKGPDDARIKLDRDWTNLVSSIEKLAKSSIPGVKKVRVWFERNAKHKTAAENVFVELQGDQKKMFKALKPDMKKIMHNAPSQVKDNPDALKNGGWDIPWIAKRMQYAIADKWAENAKRYLKKLVPRWKFVANPPHVRKHARDPRARLHVTNKEADKAKGKR